MIAVVDSGGANIASVMFALERLGAAATFTADADVIRAASRVILPGVGTAGFAMRHLQQSGLADLIPTLRQPVLGICLGMQLLFESSAEGNVQTLGIMGGTVQKLAPPMGQPLPHMGWNALRLVRDHPILHGITANEHAYFVHSYGAPVGTDTLAACDYGMAFSAIVARDNFAGCQFHPERSATTGHKILENFLGWQP